MKLPKHKVSMLVVVFAVFGLSSAAAVLSPARVSAANLTYNIECSDKAKGLNTKKDDAKHEAEVTCKDGKAFDYQAGGTATNKMTAKCPGEEKVVSRVNNGKTKITLYCAKLSGSATDPKETRTNNTPTVNVTVREPGEDDGDGGGDGGGNQEDEEPDNSDCKAGSGALNKENCGIINLIVTVTNVMAGLAATVIVASITIAGIQYASAGADPSKVQAAKSRMLSALTALMLLIFGYALLQWLVPGGLF